MILSILAYGLIGIAGFGVWCGLVNFLTHWKQPWLRVVSVTLLCSGVAVVASLITATVLEEREARETHEAKEEPNQPLQRNASKESASSLESPARHG